MVNQYETVFIATPVLSEAQMKEAVAKYTQLIRDNGGEVVYEEDWGLRQLAYPIQHKTTGFYYLIEFKADSQFVATLETQYHRDERIIRFLTVAPLLRPKLPLKKNWRTKLWLLKTIPSAISTLRL